MRKMLLFTTMILILFAGVVAAQTNEWETDYVIFDDSNNGTGDQTSSAAAVDSNRFVALVTETPDSPVLENLFTPPGNYLVGYWDADSGMGLVNSPIGGTATTPEYGGTGKFTDWEAGLDKVTLLGAWQLASDNNYRVYVANNDEAHNILVFELTADGVIATDNRMETGTANIFGIDLDTAGYVYVVDYQGDDDKKNEVRVYAGIDAPGTTWSGFGGHTDAPKSTIDLPPGIYQGITVSDDGSAVYVSATSERAIWKYTGDPESGYTLDENFMFTLSEDDTVGNGGSGTPSVLGLAYLNDPPLVYAAVDTFIAIGGSGGYPYARIYAIDAQWGTSMDTVDVAEWNLAVTGDYSSGSNNGRAGGFGSIIDVDVEPSQKAVYTQTYYGWAVEKWVFDGNLDDIVGAIVELTNAEVPEKFNLHQNYPNPFNPNTTIAFDINRGQFVILIIYNTVGQKITTLLNGNLTAGSYKIDFDAGHLPSGVYFYQLKSADYTAVKKMILTK